MTRAATINANRPAVQAAVAAYKPSLKGSDLVEISGLIGVYLHDHGYSVTDPWFPTVVEDAIVGYDQFQSRF